MASAAYLSCSCSPLDVTHIFCCPVPLFEQAFDGEDVTGRVRQPVIVLIGTFQGLVDPPVSVAPKTAQNRFRALHPAPRFGATEITIWKGMVSKERKNRNE